jgi:diguanylate cyclase (GGDEF)-like protein
MLRKVLIRLGILRANIALTLFAILFSVLVTLLVGGFFFDGSVDISGLSIAVIVPLIISPLISTILLRILFQLDAAENQLRELSRRDSLTGVYNRAYFIELAERELARTLRYGSGFSIAILDVDDFKQVNDTHGHLAGDKVLQTLSEICLRYMRQTDTIARFGGDEFVVLFPYADQQRALECMERIRGILAETPLTYAEGQICLTISVGLAAYDSSHTELDMTLQQADKALYLAKTSGKNRTVVSN